MDGWMDGWIVYRMRIYIITDDEDVKRILKREKHSYVKAHYDQREYVWLLFPLSSLCSTQWRKRAENFQSFEGKECI